MVEINKLLLGISQQTALDYVISIIIAILFMRGIHDLYLFAYKHRLAKVKNLEIFVDSWFSYKPNWVWVYVSLYPVIIISAYTTKSINQFTYSLFSYFILALILMIFYILFPVKVPEKWHKVLHRGNSFPEKMMISVRKFDAPGNCFPSMHVSAATLTVLHLMANLPQLGIIPLIYLLLISMSVLYTKQHYIADIIPGYVVGWISYKIFESLYGLYVIV
ncbi:phosphatase PAP2 family protein [Candidatus Woesearchaeota archaeon]|nr:phosphatase PAP2 family protein [Candidatus Woesearchaeota archaeon]